MTTGQGGAADAPAAAALADCWSDAFLDAMRQRMDPPADRTVQAVFAEGHVAAVNDLMKALVRNDGVPATGLPRAVYDFLAETDLYPAWTDPALIRQSEAFFGRYGPAIAVALFHAALPASYAAAKGVRVLDLTARLVTDPKRRIVETAQFLLDVMAPGALAPGGRGLRVIQKVRLMHAAVRYLILHSGQWEPAWDQPINQEDLGGTLLCFTAQTFEGLDRLGIKYAPADAEAYLHAWKVVGVLLGIVPELLPRDVDDAQALMATIKRRQFTGSAAGQRMTAALLDLLADITPGRALDGYSPALMRRMLGDETADLLGIPPSDWTARLVQPASGFFGGLAAASGVTHLTAQAQGAFGRALLNAVLRVERGGRRVAFNIPTELEEQWQLPAAAEQ